MWGWLGLHGFVIDPALAPRRHGTRTQRSGRVGRIDTRRWQPKCGRVDHMQHQGEIKEKSKGHQGEINVAYISLRTTRPVLTSFGRARVIRHPRPERVKH